MFPYLLSCQCSISVVSLLKVLEAYLWVYEGLLDDMDGSYQCHTCLREFSRSNSLRRHLESGICKQNEQSEDDPSGDYESQQDDEDDNSSSEEDELAQNQSEIRTSSP